MKSLNTETFPSLVAAQIKLKYLVCYWNFVKGGTDKKLEWDRDEEDRLTVGLHGETTQERRSSDRIGDELMNILWRQQD